MRLDTLPERDERMQHIQHETAGRLKCGRNPQRRRRLAGHSFLPDLAVSLQPDPRAPAPAAVVKLTNVTAEHIAYKLLCNLHVPFSMRGTRGVVAPGGHAEVTIELKKGSDPSGSRFKVCAARVGRAARRAARSDVLWALAHADYDDAQDTVGTKFVATGRTQATGGLLIREEPAARTSRPELTRTH
jgi:hypothetical protein